MSDTREILRRTLGDYVPPTDRYERVLVRRNRRRRNQRIVAGAVAIAVSVVAALGLVRILGSEPTPAEPEPVPAKNGKIVYSDGDGVITVIEPDGSERVELTSGDYPTWSADGTKIAYVEGPSLSVMNADGSDQTQVQGPILDGGGSFFHPSWSPDGTQIVFAAEVGGAGRRRGSYKLYVVNVDGSGLIRITHGHHQDWWPSWSPDGTHIAFITHGQHSRHLATMSPDGSDRTTLVGGWNEYPDWSPDGDQVLFVNARNGWDVFRINIDGTELTQLTDTPQRQEFFPVFSPDGTQIAFRRPAHGRHTYIVTMVIGGTDIVRVTEVDHAEDSLDWQAT